VVPGLAGVPGGPDSDGLMWNRPGPSQGHASWDIITPKTVDIIHSRCFSADDRIRSSEMSQHKVRNKRPSAQSHILARSHIL
jgi:hypothetical protein